MDIQKVVHEVLPKGYSERIETGNDASGSPAIWVWLIAPDKAKLDKATIVDISDAIECAPGDPARLQWNSMLCSWFVS